jgi:hypothetical protein
MTHCSCQFLKKDPISENLNTLPLLAGSVPEKEAQNWHQEKQKKDLWFSESEHFLINL